MDSLRTLLSRCAAVVRRGSLDRQLDEELQSHLDFAMEENRRQGLSEQDARDAALRAFGGVTQVREKVRLREGVPLLEDLRRDVGYAVRQMRKSPGFAATAILTLALGIAATITIFTLVYSTLLRAMPYPDAERIVAIHDVRLEGQSTAGLTSVPRFFDLRARNRSFAAIGFFYFDQPTLIAGTKLPLAVHAVGANAGFWQVFATRPLLGRTFTAADDRPNAPDAVVLSYAGWQKLFDGDAGVVGRQITLDGKAATVAGVMPRSFQMPGGIDLWRPAHFDAADWGTYRGEGTRFVSVYARLQPGLQVQRAQSDLQRIGDQLRREHPDSDASWQFRSESLRENRFGMLRPALLVLMLASGLLLTISCINVANLLLSRATARQREVALRRALGASAARVVMQFLTESMLLALTGGAVGAGTALALIHSLAARLPGRLGTPGVVEMHGAVVWFALLVSAIAGITFGLAPALLSRHVALNAAMKQGDGRLGGSAGNAIRSVLVSVQVGLSLILLVGASLLAESLWHLLKSPLGFEPEHLLTFSLRLPWNSKEDHTRNFYADVQRRIEALPGVTAVGQIDAPPAVDWHLRSNFDADWLPRTAGQPAINAEDRSIAGNFLRAMETPLLAGRTFTDQDQAAKSAPVLVNQELVRRYLHGANPIGRHLQVNGEAHEIVGVIADLRGTAGSIANAPGPEVYWPADANGGVTHRYFLVRSQLPPEQLIRSIRTQIHELDAQQAIGEIGTMDHLLDVAVAQPRLNMTVVACFALIALVLACVGIYGVVAYFVAQRSQEIGVRMALGATRSRIALLFVRRAALSAALGLAGGTCIAAALAQLLRSQLYGVTPNDPVVYLAAILALVLSVLMATVRPALRAAWVNPAEALRRD